MRTFNQSSINLKFEVSKLYGQSMSLEFLVNNKSVDTYPQLSEPIFNWAYSIDFPTTLEIRVSNKGPRDTIIDIQGNIIEDKYIKLLDIVVDGLSCAPYYVNTLTFTTDQGQEIQTNYWGFNGSAKLEFLETNSFYWSINTQNKSYG